MDNLVGTSGNDTFRGDNTTISGADTIDGMAGTDKAELFFANAAAATYQLSSDNVEQFYLQSTGGGATFNAINVEDGEQFWSQNSTAALTVTNIQNAAAIGVSGGNGANYLASFNNSVVSGSADTGTIALDAANVGNLGLSGTTVTNEFETLNINAANGASTVTALTQSGLGALAATQTINVTGAGSVTVTGAVAASLTTLNAAENTGGVSFNLAGTGAVKATGGTGNDTFLFGTSLTAADTVDGGEGSNTLGANGATLNGLTSKLTGVSNIGTLFVQDDIGANATVNAANFGGSVENIRVAAQTVGGQTLTVNGIKAVAEGSNNIRFDGVMGGAGDTHSFNIAGATDPGTANAVTLDIRGAVDAAAQVVALAGVETVTVSTANATGAKTFNLTAASLEELIVSGRQSVDLSGAALGANVEKVDASGLTNNAGLTVVLNPGAATGANVTGSAGADTITGSNLKDVIDAGAGVDNVNASGGQDVITLGAGADNFNIGTPAAVAAAGTVIGANGVNMVSLTDFVAGTDKINLQYAALTGVTFDGVGDAFAGMADVLTSSTAVNSLTDVWTQLGASLTAGNFAASAAAGTATVARVVEFTQGDSAGKYLVINDATAGFNAATDIVIDVTGVTGTISATDFGFYA